MAKLTVKDLGPITVTTTTAGSVSNIFSNVDDAYDITIYISSSANAASTGTIANITMGISQNDPNMVVIGKGVVRSSSFYPLLLPSTTLQPYIFSSGKATTVPGGGYRSFQLQNFTSPTANEVVGWASARFFV